MAKKRMAKKRYEQQYRFAITGLSPLIMHRDDLDWADKMEAARTNIKEQDKKQFKAGDDRCPPHTWKGYVYHDNERIVVPTDNLRSCMMKAGARITLKNQRSYKELSQSSLLFDALDLPLLSPADEIAWSEVDAIKGCYSEQAEAAKALGFKLLAKRAAVRQAKHVRVRPVFDVWAVTGTFTVEDEQLTTEVIERLWVIAGLNIGIGDWRPGSPKSPGPYGRFAAEVEAV